MKKLHPSPRLHLAFIFLSSLLLGYYRFLKSPHRDITAGTDPYTSFSLLSDQSFKACSTVAANKCVKCKWGKQDELISFSYQRQDFIKKKKKTNNSNPSGQVCKRRNKYGGCLDINFYSHFEIRPNCVCVCLSQPCTQFAHVKKLGEINKNEDCTPHVGEAEARCVLREGYNCPGTHSQNWALGTPETIRTDTCIHLHSVHVHGVTMCWFRLGLS